MTRRIIFSILIVITFSSFLFKTDKGNKRAFYECTEPLKIDTSLFDLRYGQTYFYFDKNTKPGKLKSKGFVWMDDTLNDYFTAYLVNMSDSTFKAQRQDRSLIMIQEAMDEKGEWKPIEYWVYSGCGNSYFYPLKLDSGKYVMIPIKQYHGSFKTKFRLKMKNYKALIYSEPFEGSIEKSQFKKQIDNVGGILYNGPANYLNEN